VLHDDHDDLPEEANLVTNPDDALAAAEEAEAEAAEAEAQAAAARARARAIRLRRQAAAAAAATAEVAAPTVEAPVAVESDAEGEPGAESSAIELDEPAVEETVPDAEKVDEYPAAPNRLRLVLKIVAATLVIAVSVALLALSVLMYLHHRDVEAQGAQKAEQTAEFTAAARQGAITLMSLNYNNAKADVQRIIDNTTGDFKKDFQGTAEDFIKVAQSSKVVTEANVTAVGIQTMTKDTATALVAVTTRVSNQASNKQDPRAWRLSVELARDNGQIKLAKVEFVP
jgi:Mce-associated membrane protein